MTRGFFDRDSSGREVYRYTLANRHGNRVSVLDKGGIIQSVVVGDRSGRPVDVALGFDSLAEYARAGGYVGALIGRVANRTVARFSLYGREYPLYANEQTGRGDGGVHLHGGREGFDRKLWTAEEREENCLELRYVSPDGEEGYPGTLSVRAIYTWDDDNRLMLDFTAESDRDTPVSLTNHAYFNLNGHAHPDGMAQLLKVNAAFYTPVGHDLIPTGEVLPVAGTPLDFREARVLSEALDEQFPQIALAGGYDHNLVLDGAEPAAVLTGRETGISMMLSTTYPGVQLYGANGLGRSAGKEGAAYGRRCAVCLEPQFFPDSLHRPHFPPIVLPAGRTFRASVAYRFAV